MAAIHVAAWQEAYAHIFEPEFLQRISVEERRTMWTGHLAAVPPRHHTHVAEDTQIVGFCGCGPSRDADVPGLAEVYAVYIDPSYWGRGAGTALMEAVRLALRQDGYTEAVLWVLEANSRARAFYEGLGWTADGANKPYQAGTTVLRYRSRLQGSHP
jgi:ribosomal protein S18 acetylase RimI-like enzyme